MGAVPTLREVAGGYGGVGEVVSEAMTAGSILSTAYPPTAPAPNPGAKTRSGAVITPPAFASAIASGMLAAEVLPTVSMLKYS